MKKKINILFVCRYNRFRSRVAEAYFKKINKNKNISVKSAGLIQGMPLDKTQVTMASSKKFGLDIRGKSQGLSSKLMIWQNTTIIVADDVPPQVFDRNKEYDKKVIVWKINDSKVDGDKEEARKIIKKIIKKVDGLVKELK